LRAWGSPFRELEGSGFELRILNCGYSQACEFFVLRQSSYPSRTLLFPKGACALGVGFELRILNCGLLASMRVFTKYTMYRIDDAVKVTSLRGNEGLVV
jgi:hypothetical protein